MKDKFDNCKNMKKFPAASRKPTIGRYICDLLKDSLLTGVPQIVTTSNCCRKFWKTLVLFGCLGGFFYQLSAFLRIYWSYPMLVDLQISFPERVELPAITICNYNGLNRKKFCSRYPDKCDVPENLTEFCEIFPQVCESMGDPSNILIPKYEYRTLEEGAEKETVMTFGLHEKEIFVSCELHIVDAIENCPNVTSSFINFYEDVPRICYTMNARYRSTKRLPIIKINNEIGVITLILNLQADEYFRPDRPVFGVLAIHPSDVISDPFDDGIVIEQGKIYDIRPSQETIELLPAPFNTNCSDDVTLPDGLNTLEGCIDNCILNTYYKYCGCLKSLTVLPDPRELCTKADEECIDRADVSHCNDVCPRPCMYSVYKTDIEEHELQGFVFQERSVEKWISRQKQDNILTTVKIIFQHPPVTIKKHVPKYQTVELFSHIGGYVGMWLGMSLIALLDFLEMIVMILNFCYKKMSEKPKHVRRIAVIQSDSGDEIVYRVYHPHRKRKGRTYARY